MAAGSAARSPESALGVGPRLPQHEPGDLDTRDSGGENEPTFMGRANPGPFLDAVPDPSWIGTHRTDPPDRCLAQVGWQGNLVDRRLHGHVAFFPDERVLRWLPHAAHTEQHPCLLLFSQRFPVFSQALGDNSASRDPNRHRGDAYAVLALEIAGESHAISNQLILAGELKRLIDLNHRDGITSGIKDEKVRGRIVPIRSFALPASVERRILRVDRAGRRPDTTYRE